MTHPAVRQRPLNQPVYETAMESGYSELQARIIAGRIVSLKTKTTLSETISPALSKLDAPRTLPDIEKAVTRIADAIQNKETILCVTDHDADGGNAHAVVVTALCENFMVPPINVKSYISHRMREGYGISNALVDRILAEVSGPALMLTSDQGSTDEPRFARLLEYGIETIVTDHHEIPEAGIPKSAVACVNPTRKDSLFPDATISGCHVAFLLMCAVREELIRRRYLPPTAPKLTSLACYVAISTIADCMDMATSINNRAIVRFGLFLMNTNPRPCWRALRRVLQKNDAFTAETIGFLIGPIINSSGRLDDAMQSVKFLLSKSEEEAYRLATLLFEQNKTRRELQLKMLETAMPIARLQSEFGVSGLVVYMPDGHAGIHGIAASRIVESFGRPTVCFSPKQGHEGVITGSLRSIRGVHIRDALIRANEIAGGNLLISCGGHAMASGCSLLLKNLEQFQAAFRQAIAEQRDPRTMAPLVETDGSISRSADLEMLSELSALEPYGREFPAPVFEGTFILKNIRAVGDGRHLKLELIDDHDKVQSGIWFGGRENADEPLPAFPGQHLSVVYTISANTYRGKTNVDLKIQTARVLEESVL